METLRLQIDKEKAKIFREQAMRMYGHSKGSISKALNKAVDDWLQKTDAKKRKITAGDLLGIASDIRGPTAKIRKEAVAYWGKSD